MSAEELAGRRVPPPFGVVRDVGAFYSALVPKHKTASAPRALVPTVDVVLTAKGRPVRWICTGESGETTEKLSTDKAAMLRVFQTAGEMGRGKYGIGGGGADFYWESAGRHTRERRARA
jgi:hypothetical protein